MDNYIKKITAYKKAMGIASEMLRRRIIDTKDYDKLEAKMANKYGVNSCSIYRLLS